MGGALFRPQLWLATAFLALTLADGCDLNPQPLPPAPGLTSGADDGGATLAPGQSTGSSGGSGSGANNTSSGAGSGSGSSSGGAGGGFGSADAGAASSSGSSSGAQSGGSSGSSSGAPEDAGEPVLLDAAADGSTPADAASDGGSEGDAGCVRSSDCYWGHPGLCSICRWPVNYPVCVEGQCTCACEEGDAAGKR
jgi:hypothetical protein